MIILIIITIFFFINSILNHIIDIIITSFLLTYPEIKLQVVDNIDLSSLSDIIITS